MTEEVQILPDPVRAALHIKNGLIEAGFEIASEINDLSDELQFS